MNGKTFDGGSNNDTQGLGIYGQTAPSPGINLADITLSIEGDDIFIQHLRFQNRDTGYHNPYGFTSECANLNPPQPEKCYITARDCISIDSNNLTPDDIVFDHITSRWCPDGTIDWGKNSNDTQNLTITHSLLYEPLRWDVMDNLCVNAGNPWACCTGPGEGDGTAQCIESAKLSLARTDNSNLFWYRNVMAMADQRMPRFTGNSAGETMTGILAENYIYGPQIWNAMIYDADGAFRVAGIGNQVVAAETTNKDYAHDHFPGFWDEDCAGQNQDWGAGSEFYFIDNLTSDGNTINDAVNWDHATDYNPVNCDDPENYKITSAPDWLPVNWIPETINNTTDLTNLKTTLLGSVGARPAERSLDTDDSRIIAEIASNTGDSIKRCVKLGVYPCDNLNDVVHNDSGTYPDFGFTSSTELNIPPDPHGDTDGDGYTNLEEWLHGLARDVEVGSGIGGVYRLRVIK
jgi:hypothetical protein